MINSIDTLPAAHSPASARPLDLPWEHSDLRGEGGHAAPALPASPRQHRVRHAYTLSIHPHAQGLQPWSASTAACLARHTPSLVVRRQWPSCWCMQRGQVLTQEPCGSTLRSLFKEGGKP